MGDEPALKALAAKNLQDFATVITFMNVVRVSKRGVLPRTAALTVSSGQTASSASLPLRLLCGFGVNDPLR